MRYLLPEEVDGFFQRLCRGYDVLLPVRLADGSRAFGTPAEGPAALEGGTVPGKPVAPFLPHQGALFTAAASGVQPPALPQKPLLLTGLTPRDLAALAFVDRFFAEGTRDDVYFGRRDGAVVAGVSGACGVDGAFLPPAGKGCDLEFIADGRGWLVAPYTTAGEEVAAALPDDPAGAERLRGLREREAPADDEELFIRRAAELVRSEQVPDAFWEEIGKRCIACTGCTLVCPTCTCFSVEDRRFEGSVERSRMWDSCQLDGFMREASGHNPLGTPALRIRRRIHHKLAADPVRWGEISCFVCGRCDAVCPTKIGILAVAAELVARCGGG